jgi:hypothetical protein
MKTWNFMYAARPCARTCGLWVLHAAPSPVAEPCALLAGKTVGENLAAVPELSQGQSVILPIETPIKTEGHIQVTSRRGRSGRRLARP